MKVCIHENAGQVLARVEMDKILARVVRRGEVLLRRRCWVLVSLLPQPLRLEWWLSVTLSWILSCAHS